MSSHPTGHPESGTGAEAPMRNLTARLVFAWTFVGVPLAYGVYETVKKAAALFTG